MSGADRSGAERERLLMADCAAADSADNASVVAGNRLLVAGEICAAKRRRRRAIIATLSSLGLALVLFTT